MTDDDKIYRQRTIWAGNCANGFEFAAFHMEHILMEHIHGALQKEKGQKSPLDILRDTIYFHVSVRMPSEALVAYIFIHNLWDSFPKQPELFDKTLERYLAAAVIDHLIDTLSPHFYLDS